MRLIKVPSKERQTLRSGETFTTVGVQKQKKSLSRQKTSQYSIFALITVVKNTHIADRSLWGGGLFLDTLYILLVVLVWGL